MSRRNYGRGRWPMSEKEAARWRRCWAAVWKSQAVRHPERVKERKS